MLKKSDKVFGDNLCFRTLAFPLINIERFLGRYFYQFSEDSHKLANWKGRHKGERCFIIGNGPSLRANDLDRLQNEFCFAFNCIDAIFCETKWRPSVYMCVDAHILEDHRDQIAHFRFPVLLSRRARKAYRGRNHIIYIENYVPFVICRYNRTKGIGFSYDASHCLYGGATVVYFAIQLAVYMGFSEIYLLGVDHSYSRAINAKGETIVNDSVKNYFGDLQTMPYTIQAIDVVEAAYRTARKHSEASDFKIYNLTRGGKLEIFERKALEDVL